MKYKLARFLRDKSISETDMIAFSNHLKEMKEGPAGSRRDKFRDNVEIAIKEMLVSYIHTHIKFASKKLLIFEFNSTG